MDAKELKIIKELMDQLSGEMEYTPDDLESRLGRKKPEGVTIIKMEKGSPEMEAAEEKLGADLDDDHEEGEGLEHMRKVLGGDDEDMEMSPDDDLKKRVMRLRG